MDVRFESAVRSLHSSPNKLRHNRQLLEALGALYDCPLDKVWPEYLEPFIRANGDAVQAIYERHDRLPSAQSLDEFEGLLVLERLHVDRGSLRQAWPFAMDELSEIADIAGVRVYVD